MFTATKNEIRQNMASRKFQTIDIAIILISVSLATNNETNNFHFHSLCDSFEIGKLNIST